MVGGGEIVGVFVIGELVGSELHVCVSKLSMQHSSALQ